MHPGEFAVRSLSPRAHLRPRRSLSGWIRTTAVTGSLILIGSMLQPAGPATAAQIADDREQVALDLTDGGPSVRRAAETALTGSDADLRSYLAEGRTVA